jgi:hypothetical protein
MKKLEGGRKGPYMLLVDDAEDWAENHPDAIELL